MPKTFIIIPTFNHLANLSQVVLDVLPYGQVVVVDDGSEEPVQLANKEVVVLRHLFNRGQGAALQTGMDYAKKMGAEIVVHFDADGQHQAVDIPRVIQPIITGQVDIVFGSRFLSSPKDNVPFLKKWLILKPNIWLQNLFLNCQLSDVHNGFRALGQTALSKIYLKQSRMAHATEIVQQTIKYQLKYQEVLVTIKYSEFGQGLRGGIKIFRDLLVKKINH